MSYVSAEIFGFWRLIGFYPFLILWISLDGCALYTLWKYSRQTKRTLRWPRIFPLLIIVSFAATSLFICFTAEPNNFDSQTYHLPRIEHWLQNGSLVHYPAPDYRQNAYGPLAEVLLLHTRVLSNSDDFYLLIQWISMVCCVIAVFRITQQLGGNDTQSWIAAIFVTTLPMGILQSTSTQNDYVVAGLLVCFVSLGLEALTEEKSRFILLLEMATAGALSGIAKPTGYLIGSGFAVWFFLVLTRRLAIRTVVSLIVASSIIFAVFVTPFVFRNIRTYGSISPDAEIVMNGSFGIEQALSNFVLNVASNLAVNIPEVNAFTTKLALRIASGLGLEKHAKDTLFLEQPFALPGGLSILHEDVAPNPVHTILIGTSLLLAAIRWPAFAASRLGPYVVAWFFGFFVYSATLRWLIVGTRYALPAFILVAPAAAMGWPDTRLRSKYTIALLLVLTCSGIPALLLNASRPLVSFQSYPPSFLRQDRIEGLFANNPGEVAYYVEAVDALVEIRASQIGLLLESNRREYPIWKMLRERKLDYPVRLEHVALSAPSERADRQEPSEARTTMTTRLKEKIVKLKEEMQRLHGLSWPLGPFAPQALVLMRSDANLSVTFQGKRFLRISGPGPISTFTTAERVPSVRDIDVPASRLGGASLSHGWATPESWGIWTIGREAKIAIAAPPGPLALVITARGFPGKSGAQVADVLINGGNVGRMIFDSGDTKTARLEVPNDRNKTDGIIHILFRISDPTAPNEFDASIPDSRLLGLGLIRLSLRQTTTPMTPPVSQPNTVKP